MRLCSYRDSRDGERLAVLADGRALAASDVLPVGVAQIISHCSQTFTLDPDEVIATGAPAGVGAFRKPPIWLGDGDEMVVEIEHLGRLLYRCRRAAAA
jgi:2-keto-4-pentenoate hydratase/2-oxohepta-3-ene-1,7-dioic acid hydratase in catechol pathway